MPSSRGRKRCGTGTIDTQLVSARQPRSRRQVSAQNVNVAIFLALLAVIVKIKQIVMLYRRLMSEKRTLLNSKTRHSCAHYLKN
jgi:hypothetical protein